MQMLYPHFNDDNVWIYDLEVYPNIFTAAFYNASNHKKRLFEISTRKNDLNELLEFLAISEELGQTHVGFNNLGFDYPIIHMILELGGETTLEIINRKCQELINVDWNNRWSNIIREPRVKQIDLMKLHHFDNTAKMTSLKTLECNMFLDNVQDLPFPVGSTLTESQMDELIKYNWHDVHATFCFFMESQSEIKLRNDLNPEYINFPDSKIGSEIFKKELDQAGIKCSNKIQSKRDSIDLSECIFKYISFETVDFNRVLDYLRSQVITETKGVFSGLVAESNGFEFVLGTGGLHGSVSSEIFESNDTHVIVDFDFASYYPWLAIANSLYPEHLGVKFCDVYKDLYYKRKSFKKGTAENAALKIALNATYGNSNNKYSYLYDPKFTMKITINGQLTLMMLAEQMMKIPDSKLIQVNTDGLTLLLPRDMVDHANSLCRWIEELAGGLELEAVEYSRMFIADVNSYIAEYKSGNLKRKGRYCYGSDLGFHQNHSSQIVAKAAEAVMVRGEGLESFIKNHPVKQDFLIMTKTPKASHLELGGVRVQNVSRFIVTNDGEELVKVSPPKGVAGEYKRANKLTDEYFNSVMDEIGEGVWDERIHTKNKSKYETRIMSICKGFKLTLCNDIQTFVNINYDYYINEVKKVLI